MKVNTVECAQMEMGCTRIFISMVGVEMDIDAG
jgi:hypothetical protein